MEKLLITMKVTKDEIEQEQEQEQEQEEREKLRLFDDSDLDAIMKPFQDMADNAIKKIQVSGKRPIQLIEEYLNTKIKSDPLLVKQLLRIYFSTYTDEPINAGLLAPSSEGKTYATVEVAEIFPKKDVISIGRMSPTALIHSQGILVDSDGEPLSERLQKIKLDIFNAEAAGDKKQVRELKMILGDMYDSAKTLVDLNHKILLFLDNPRPETYETLKPIMSHDKKEIIYRTTKSDGSLSVKETIIRGWPVVVVCSAKNEAKNEVWAEVVSREIILSPNTDISKYHAANKLTSKKFGMPSFLSQNNQEKTNTIFYVNRLRDSLIKLCKDGNPVLNPFHEKMADLFPHNEGITMRHYKRLMSFINVETLLNANSNMKIEFKINQDGKLKNFVISSLKMIQDAITILGNISTIPPEKIKFYNEVFVPLIQEKSNLQTPLDSEDVQHTLFNISAEAKVTKEEVAEKYSKVFRKTITPKSILDNYLKYLSDEGILDSIANPENKKQNLYFISSKLSIHNLDNIIRQLNAKDANYFLYIWSCLARPLQLARKTGKTIRLYNDENEKIDYYLFNNLLYLNNNNYNNNIKNPVAYSEKYTPIEEDKST